LVKVKLLEKASQVGLEIEGSRVFFLIPITFIPYTYIGEATTVNQSKGGERR